MMAQQTLLSDTLENDPGDDTFLRYRYQASLTAEMALRMLNEPPDFKELYSEHIEDILAIRKDGKKIAIQVKTRSLPLGPFKATTSSITHALKRFVAHERKFGEQIAEYRIITNSSFESKNDSGTNLRFLIALARKETSSSLQNPYQSLIRDMGLDEEDTLLSVLCKLELIDSTSNTPSLLEFSVFLERAVKKYLAQHPEMPQTPELFAKGLMLLAENAMAYSEDADWSDYLAKQESMEEIKRCSVLANKRITPIDVLAIFDNFGKGKESRVPYLLMTQNSQDVLLSPYSTQKDEFQEHDVFQIKLDQLEFAGPQRSIKDLSGALKKQKDAFRQLQDIRAKKHIKATGYAAIAHIPLLFHIGHLASSTWSPQLFERAPDSESWIPLKESSDGFPKLELIEEPNYTENEGDVVLRISMSAPVSESDVKKALINVGYSHIASAHLRLERIERFLVRSSNQLSAYAQIFRETLTLLREKVPNYQRLHIFCAASATSCFEFGRCLNPTMHPEVIVYNFNASDNPKYSWGLELIREAVVQGKVTL